MSEISSTQPTTDGPCSPIFGTATFSTLTATALTTMFAGSSSHSESSTTCGDGDNTSETRTYQEDDTTEIEDDLSPIDEEGDSRTERSSQVDDTLSETSSSFLYPRRSRGSSVSEEFSSHSTSRPPSYSNRSHSEHSNDTDPYSTRSGSSSLTGSWSRRSAGELIAMFEGRAASSRANTPFPSTSSRSASPVKSTVSSGPHNIPGGLPAPFRRTGPPWASTSEYTYTYSSRPSSPSKSAVSASTTSSWSFSISNSGSYDRSNIDSTDRSTNENSSRSSGLSTQVTQERRTATRGAVPSTSSGVIPPPLDLSEYGCTGRPIQSGHIWYLNAHRLGPYTWQRAEAYLYPHVIILSWISPDQGRLVVRLDLLSCLEVRTAAPIPYVDEETGQPERGGERVTARFDLMYDDSIERLGSESREDMLDWFTVIQSVFHGTMTVDEYPEPPTPVTYSSASAQEIDRESACAESVYTSASFSSPAVTDHSPSSSAHISSQSYPATFTTLTTLTPCSSSLSTAFTSAHGSDRTVLDTVSRSGTDIVASTLSRRNSSDASLLGDSCSYMTPRSRSDTPTPQRSSASDSWDHTPCISNETSTDGPPSPASAYETADAASPSASESFMSLPDISSFPDDEEENRESMSSLDTADTPDMLPPETPGDQEIAAPPEEAIHEAPDAAPTDVPSETATNQNAVDVVPEVEKPEEPKYSEQGVETDQPEPEQESGPASELPDANVEESPSEVIPASEAPADEPAKEEMGVQASEGDANLVTEEEQLPEETAPKPMEEPAPPSPDDDALSALSLTMPGLPPPGETSDAKEQPPPSPSERSATPIAHQPQPGAVQTSMSTGDDVGQSMDLASPSVTASIWGAETDGSYDSSVLDPSLSSCSQFPPSAIDAPRMLSRVASIPSALLSPSDSLLTPIKETSGQLAANESFGNNAELLSSIHTEDASLISVARAQAYPATPSLVSSESESLSSSAFGESVASDSVLRLPAIPIEETQSEVQEDRVELTTASTVDSPSVATNVAAPVLAPHTVISPVVRSLSIQCESADDIASFNFGHKLTHEADRVIQQLYVFEQIRSQDKIEVKDILLELLELARREPKGHIDWNPRLDRSVGGSVVMSPSSSPSIQLGVNRSVGGTVDLAAPPEGLQRGVDRSVGGSVVSSPPKSVTNHAILRSALQEQEMNIPLQRTVVLSTVEPQETAILLTPPPQRPLSADSMTDAMSYLSSHYSDDLELNVNDMSPPLEVEPVSPSWASSLSADRVSNGSSLSGLTTEVGDITSRAAELPSFPTSLNAAEGPAAHEIESEPVFVQPPSSSSASPPLPAGHPTAQFEFASLDVSGPHEEPLQRSMSLQGSPTQVPVAIHMPMPVRAGEPFDGQLAQMLKEGSPQARSAPFTPSLAGFATSEKAAGQSPVHVTTQSVLGHSEPADSNVKWPTDNLQPHTPVGFRSDVRRSVASSPSRSVPMESPPHYPEQRNMDPPVMNASPRTSEFDLPALFQENLRLQHDNLRMHQENRRVYEEHRLVQEEMKNSFVQMKELLMGLLSSKPLAPPAITPNQGTSPYVFTAQVPPTVSTGDSARSAPAHAMPYPTYYPYAGLPEQPVQLLPQMTANYLPPPPFMHTANSEIDQPVIPQHPSAYTLADQTPDLPGQTMANPSDMRVRAVPATTLTSCSTSPSLTESTPEPSERNATFIAHTQIPLPASVITVVTELSPGTTPTVFNPNALTAADSPRAAGDSSIAREAPIVRSSPAALCVAPESQEPPLSIALEQPKEVDNLDLSPISVNATPLTREAKSPQTMGTPLRSPVIQKSPSVRDDVEHAAAQPHRLPPDSSLLFARDTGHIAQLERSPPSVMPQQSEISSEAHVLAIPALSSSVQTSPVVMFNDTAPVPSLSEASLQTEGAKQSEKGVASSPSTVSASTSPVHAVSTIANETQTETMTEKAQGIAGSPKTISACTSPLQSAAPVTTSSQTEPDTPDMSRSVVTISACTSPIERPILELAPVIHVDRASSPVIDLPMESSHGDHGLQEGSPPAALSSESLSPTMSLLDVGNTALAPSEDTISKRPYSSVDMRRSSWSDAASQFQLLMESTQSTAHEALEVLRKTQALLDDVQRPQALAVEEIDSVPVQEATSPQDEPGGSRDEELALLREELVELKQRFSETRESSDSRMTSILERLVELQSSYEREVDRRASQESEQAADRETLLSTLVAERERRIADLEAVIEKLKSDNGILLVEHNEAQRQSKAEAEEREAANAQKIQEHDEAVTKLCKEIETLQAELDTLRAQRTQHEQLQIALDAEREEALAEQDRLASEDALEKEQLLSERDACILALREALEKQTMELQQAGEREAASAARDSSQTETIAEHLETIETMKRTLSEMENEHAQAREEWASQKSALETEQAEKDRVAAEREAELQAKIETLQKELDDATAILQTEIQRRIDEVAQLETAHAESDQVSKEAALEREKSFIEKYDAAVKEFREELSALRAAYEQSVEMQKSEATEQREVDRTDARERAEQLVSSLTELRDKLLRMEERSEEQWTQQFAKHSDVSTQLDKIEEDAAEERRKAEEYRLQREEERVEAASKPSVQSAVEGLLREFADQMREQIDTADNGLRADISRQHGEALDSVNNAVQQQALSALDNCLQEMSKQLDTIGERQHNSLLDSMRTTVQEQITLHISYYLSELGKLMDTQHAQQLTELLETVRSTMQEQVIYNVETYLDDLCRRLVPEISQLLKEVRDKAEEKHKLNRQIDCLRDIKREHEPGGRLYDSDTATANHPGLKEFNKKAWRKHKSKPADRPAPAVDADVQLPAYDVPKQPVASYPVEVTSTWDSWSENTLSQPSAPSGQVTLYGHPPSIIPPMITPAPLTPQSTQSPYRGL